MNFKCERCNEKFSTKSILKTHLQKKNPCEPKFSSEDPKLLLSKLYDRNLNEKTYDCEFCKKKFNFTSTKCTHKKICKLNPDNKPMITIPKEEYEALQKLKNISIEKKVDVNINNIDELQALNLELQKSININNELKAVKLELQYYKNRKNELFYQLLLEQYLGGTHKSLSCGITDITTENSHCEIKEWKYWKEGVGQLTCYNTVDPKNENAIYLFGKYSDNCKLKCIEIIKKCNIIPYELKDDSDGVHIINLIDNTVIYTYSPDKDDN